MQARPTPDLLDSFQRGRRSAYDDLFTRYRPLLLRFLRGRVDAALLREVELQDLLHDTHLEALKNLDRFQYRAEHSFYFWLCRIAARRVLHEYRRRKRKPPPVSAWTGARADQSSQDLLALLSAPAPDPERRLLLSERLDFVATALEALPDDYREAILLRRVDGLSNAEAAEAIGVSPNAMSVRLSRALARLDAVLRALLGEDPRP